MKLIEVVQPESDDEPLLVVLIRQLLQKKARIARYYRSGSQLKPMWVTKISRHKSPAGPGIPPRDDWVLTCNRNGAVDYVTYKHESFDSDFELVHGKTKGTWQLQRRAKDTGGSSEPV